MPQILNDQEILRKEVPEGDELVSSLNSENCVTAATKLLIVGTLTPPQAKGYFYTSPNNRIYGYLDAALGTNLKDLKSRLELDGQADICEIKQVLKTNRIAFLDVFAHNIRKKGSSADADIHFSSLAFDAFQKLKDIENLTVICNSHLAEQYYNVIKEELFQGSGIRLPESIYCPQRGATKAEWIQIIQDALKDR